MIDFLFYFILILAIIQGWRKGLILALFSLVCGLIGLAAAVKLSAVLATHMKSTLHMTSRWLPVLAFILVFLLVIWIIHLAAKMLEKLIRLILLEWLNKLGGILLFILALYFNIQYPPVLWHPNAYYWKADSSGFTFLFTDCTFWTSCYSFYNRIYSLRSGYVYCSGRIF